MKKITTFAFFAMTAAAQAHPSLVPHQHPHGASVLPGIDTFAIALLMIVLGALALRRLLRK